MDATNIQYAPYQPFGYLGAHHLFSAVKTRANADHRALVHCTMPHLQFTQGNPTQHWHPIRQTLVYKHIFKTAFPQTPCLSIFGRLIFIDVFLFPIL